MKRLIAPILLAVLPVFFAEAGNGMIALLKKGDSLAGQLRTAEALQVFLNAEKADPANPEVHQRLSKVYAELMVDEPSKEQRQRLGELGVWYAQQAVAGNPSSAKAHLSLAITYGRLAPYLDSRTKIAYSKLVKEHAEKALELDQSSDYAHHVLGAWNYEMANLNPILKGFANLIYGKFPPASLETAEYYFQKAVELSGHRVSHRIELGRTYAALGKRELALEQLTTGLNLPNREKDDASTKKRGQELLEKLK